MTAPDLARLCAEQVIERLFEGRREPLPADERLALVESYVRGAITRALEEAGQPEARTFMVQSGHVSLDLNLNAKGDLQWGCKVVMPIDGLEPERAAQVRELAQRELEGAELFLKTRYGRQP